MVGAAAADSPLQRQNSTALACHLWTSEPAPTPFRQRAAPVPGSGALRTSPQKTAWALYLPRPSAQTARVPGNLPAKYFMLCGYGCAFPLPKSASPLKPLIKTIRGILVEHNTQGTSCGPQPAGINNGQQGQTSKREVAAGTCSCGQAALASMYF